MTNESLQFNKRPWTFDFKLENFQCLQFANGILIEILSGVSSSQKMHSAASETQFFAINYIFGVLIARQILKILNALV